MGLMRIIAVADLLRDQLRHRLDVAGMIEPAADAADRQLLKGPITLTQALKLTEA